MTPSRHRLNEPAAPLTPAHAQRVLSFTRHTARAAVLEPRSNWRSRALQCFAVLVGLAWSPSEASSSPEDFVLRSDNGRSEVTISGDLQARLEGAREDVEDDDQARTRSAFTVPRARLRLDGHTRREAICFSLQVGVDRGVPALIDAALTWRVARGEWALDAGQLRRPLSREALTPLWRQLFAERSLVQRALGDTRAVGVIFRDDRGEAAPWTWRLGILGGQGGEPVAAESAIEPELVARVERRFGVGAPYDDVDWSPEASGQPFVVTGIAASALLDGDGDQDAGFLVAADLLLKVAGATLELNAYVASAQEGAGTLEQGFRDAGVKASLGYLVAQRVQPVVRYAMISPSGRVGRLQEVAVGANVFVLSHHLRWLNEVQGRTEDLVFGERFGLVARSQLQVVF